VCSSDGVVGVDGVEERLERGRGKARGALGLAMLSNEEGANAGAEREKNRRSHVLGGGKNRTGCLRKIIETSDDCGTTSEDVRDQMSGIRSEEGQRRLLLKCSDA
jgi:hypothetical protein